ncbi:MAG: amino acid ABC transporter permease [Micrococcaceae bacterium]|nr:amino acid ABC transporter permease [Micrococcaceae bacterium]
MSTFLAILSAVPITLLTTFVSFGVGALLAVPLVLGRRARQLVVRVLSKTVIDVLRGIPPIVFIFILFFGVGADLIRWDPLVAAIVGLSLISAGHLAEVYRGGILGVHQGQFEAGAALGLSPIDLGGSIIAPQAVRTAIPGMVTWLISLLKDSSVVSAIGVVEVMFVTNQVARTTGDGITPFLIAGAVYVVIGTPLAAVSRWLVTRLTYNRGN